MRMRMTMRMILPGLDGKGFGAHRFAAVEAGIWITVR
jgi:hypothetical protein